MSRHLPHVDFYFGCAKTVNHYENVLNKALSRFVIRILDLLNCRLVIGIDCSCGNFAMFLYVNNEVSKKGGH